jgi:hypothetical protein
MNESPSTRPVGFADGIPGTLRPAGRLLLWRLAAAGGGDWIASMKPAPAAALRRELAALGLIRGEARRHRDTGRPGTWIELSDAGWSWIRDHLGQRVGAGSAAGDALTVLLRSLRGFFAARGLALEEVLRLARVESKILPFPAGARREVAEAWPEAGAAETLAESATATRERGAVPEDDPDDAEDAETLAHVPFAMLEAALVRGYLRLTDGRFGVPVRLCRLRAWLGLVPAETDAALRALARGNRARLEALAVAELTGEDREAALRGPGGELFHAVRFVDPDAEGFVP